MELKGNKYGTHRVIEPKGVLTQAAWKIDNDMTKHYSNEIICDVISLNIDSASFTQIEEACGGDEQKIGEMIMGIVAERGKQQNPVTGSGGMFIGKVAYIGEDLKDRDLKVGDKIASLVSLSLTPLKIEKILAIHKDIDRVDIIGQAVLFESGIYAKLPDDMRRCRRTRTGPQAPQGRRQRSYPRRKRQERRSLRLRSNEEGRPQGQCCRRCPQPRSGSRPYGTRRLQQGYRCKRNRTHCSA